MTSSIAYSPKYVLRTYYVLKTDYSTQRDLQITAETSIEFITSGSVAPKNHCMATMCRPVIVATQQSRLRPRLNANKITLMDPTRAFRTKFIK
jgi:hypothetical protein